MKLARNLNQFLLAGLAALGAAGRSEAAPITWSPAVNCFGDTDVLNTGPAVFAYDWSSAQTINGVNFAPLASATAGGTNVLLGFASVTATGYTNTTAGTAFNSLSFGYRNVLTGGAYKDATGISVNVILTNLTVGLRYKVQYWVSDPRGKARQETLASTNGNTTVVSYSSTGTTVGGVGSYAIGSFTADAPTQTFSVTTTGSGDVQINALQTRLDTLGFWDGAVNGAWDNTTTNFTGALSFTSLLSQTTNVWFGDNDGQGNPVPNHTVAVQAGGVAAGAVNFINQTTGYVITNAAGGSAGITGGGAVTIAGPGGVTFASPQSYTGNTTISAGKLVLGAAGSIAGSANLNLSAGAGLDVSQVAGFVLGAGQTLAGNGWVKGNVNAAGGARVVPGGANAIGTLTFSNNLTLGGQEVLFDVGSGSNDVVNVQGTLTNNGTVLVALNPLVPVSAGTDTLLTCANFSGTGSFLLDSNAVPRGASLAFNGNSLTVTLTGGGTGLVWTGDGTANVWNNRAASNWLNGASSDGFYAGDNVTFDDSGSATPAISLAGSLLPGTVTVNATRNYGFAGAGALAGAGTLNKQNSGTLVLDNSGTNTFSGGVNLSGGILQVGNNDAAGNLPAGNLTNNAVLVFARTDTQTVTGVVSGGGAVVQAGAGTTMLTGTNTYSGGTTVSNGTLQLNTVAAAGTGGITVNAGAALALFAGNGNTFNNVISGAGTVNIIGNGNINYVQLGASAAGFTGVLNIGYQGAGRLVGRSNNGGLGAGVTVNITNNGQFFVQSAGANAAHFYVSGTGDGDGLGALNVSGGAGSITGPVTLQGNTFINANSGEIAGVIDDAGLGYGFTKVNAGTLTLSAANTYHGATVISGGNVLLNTGGSISNSSPVTLAGGTLSVGTVAGGFALNTNQTLQGNGTVAGLVTAPAGAKIIPGGTGTGGTLAFTGGLVLNGQPLTFDLGATPTSTNNDAVNITGAPLTMNRNTAITLNDLAGSLAPGIYTLLTYPSLAGSGTLVLATNYSGCVLNVGATATTIAVGAGATTLVWKGDGTANNWDPTTANWLNGAAPATYVQGNNVIFNDSGFDQPAIGITANLTPSAVTVNAAQNYTFAGTGSLSGSMALTVAGAGTLTLANSNLFTGGTLINNGVLQLGTNGSGGTVAGQISDNATLVLDHGTVNLVTNLISGGGTLVMNGSGTEMLTAANTYTGGTTINSGAIQLNNASAAGPGQITLNGGALNVVAGGFKYLNVAAGTGVINVVPGEAVFSPAGYNNDYAEFDSALNITATINMPAGPGVGRVVTTAPNGGTGTYTFNISSNGQLYVKSAPLTATINLSGDGYGDGLGAVRVAPGASLAGTINLTGNASVGGTGTFGGTIQDGGAGYRLGVAAGPLTFNALAATYGGITTISNGVSLALVNGSAIENSPVIALATGATLDVSGEGISAYPIPTGITGAAASQTLAGLGEKSLIVGNVAMGAGGALWLTVTNDGNPTLAVANGTLTLTGNPVTVSVAGTPLPAGLYPLVGVATNNGVAGAVSGDVSTSSLTLDGAGLAAGNSGALVISNAMLYLAVSAPASAPVIGSGQVLPGDAGFQLTFTGSGGHPYSVTATTNLTVPAANWQTIATGTFGAGPVTNVDTDAANYPQRYYRVLSQ